MADKAKLAVPSAGCGEPRRQTSASAELLRRAEQALPRAALLDPVDSWKRLALASALKVPTRIAGIARINVKVTLGFALLCLVAGAAFGLLGPLAPLVILSSALVTAAVALWEVHRDVRDQQSGAIAQAEHAEAHLQQARSQDALSLAQRALAVARGQRLRARLLKTLAWAAIGARNPFLAHAAIGQLDPDVIDLHLIAGYLDSCNRCDEALELLMRARASGHRSHETTKLLIDLLFRQGQKDEARRVALVDHTLLNPEEQRVIEAALR